MKHSKTSEINYSLNKINSFTLVKYNIVLMKTLDTRTIQMYEENIATSFKSNPMFLQNE